MKKALMALLLVALGAVLQAQDALRAAPSQYKLLFENTEIRVLRVLTRPGERSSEHEHPARLAVRLRGKDVQPGSVVWTDAQKHAPVNNGGEVYEAVIVELKHAASGRLEEDEAAIRKHLDALTNERRTGDRRSEAQFYTGDGDEWGSGSFNKGRDALAARTAVDPRPGYRTEWVSLQFLDAQTALVDQNYFNEQQLAGHVFYLMVKRDGKWLIRSARITPVIPSR